MPQTVIKSITVAQLRKGDVLDPENVTVTDIVPKQLYAYVTVTGVDKPRRLALDSTIAVLRVEATQEERDAQRRDFAVQGLRDQLTGLLRNDPITELESITADARKRSTQYDVLTWSNLPGVLKAQAKWKVGWIIASTVHTVADRRQLPVDVNGPADVENVPADVLIDAFAIWLHGVTHKTWDGNVDPTSRSTSAISNMLEDLDRWAVGEVARELVWTGALTMLIERGDELANERK